MVTQYLNVKRKRFLPPILQVFIFAGIGTLFWLLKPSSHELLGESPIHLISESKAANSSLDLAYHRSLAISSDQASLARRRELIYEMIESGRINVARELRDSVSEQLLGEAHNRAFEIEFTWHAYHNLRTGAQKHQLAERLHQQLAAVAATPRILPKQRLFKAAQIAKDIDQPLLAAQLYFRYGEAYQEQGVDALIYCGSLYNDAANYEEAAHCYDLARQFSEDPVQRTQLGMQEFRTLATAKQWPEADTLYTELLESVWNRPQELQQLAELVLQINMPERASSLYARLAIIDAANQVKWFSEAARWAAASRQPQQAADYIATAALFVNGKHKKELDQQRLNYLRLAGDEEAALKLAMQTINSETVDQKSLIEAINLAIGLNKFKLASKWNQQLLQTNPDLALGFEKQYEIDLARQDLRQALLTVKAWVKAHPDSVAAREKLARTAEWNGNLELAQQQWQWLAENAGSLDVEMQLHRISKLNWDLPNAAAALRRSAIYTPLNSQKMQQLLRLYEDSGLLEEAIDALKEYQRLKPQDSFVLRSLAGLYRRMGDYPSALESWQDLAEQFGRGAEETLERAELLWKLRRRSQSYALISSYQGQVDELLHLASENKRKLLLELAWNNRDANLLQKVAPALIAQTSDTDHKELYLQRLINTWIDAGMLGQAIDAIADLWRENRVPDTYLQALSLAVTHRDFTRVDSLLNEARNDKEIQKSSEYWSLVAEMQQAKGQSDAAYQSWKKSLELQPDNLLALESVLWHLIGNTKLQQLQPLLEEYRNAALANSQLWLVYAQGFQLLGDNQQSLQWFNALVASGNEDYSLLLSYADSLDNSGFAERAYRVRRYALSQVRDKALQDADMQRLGSENVLNYVFLQSRYGSPSSTERWIENLLKTDYKSPMHRDRATELAIGWYLSTQRHEQARLWLLSQHARRIQTPVWQNIALALEQRDQKKLLELLRKPQHFAVSQHVLALKLVGQKEQALAVAEAGLLSSSSRFERDATRAQALNLREQMPAYASLHAGRAKLGDLGVDQLGLTARKFGLVKELDVLLELKRYELSHETYPLEVREKDFALTLRHRGDRIDSHLSVGTNQRKDDSLHRLEAGVQFARETNKQQWQGLIGINTLANNSAVLRAEAERDYANLYYRRQLGMREFISLDAGLQRFDTRSGQAIADGFSVGAGVGTRGELGANAWELGLNARSENNHHAESAKTTLSAIDNQLFLADLIAPQTHSLSVAASLSRGGLEKAYPSASGPRFYLNTELGKTWPRNDFSFLLSGGYGFRLLGNDELSMQFQYEQGLDSLQSPDEANAQLDLRYRKFF